MNKEMETSAGKSPLWSVLSQVPTHQPEFKTVSPVLESLRVIRSPLTKVRKEDPSPAKAKSVVELFGAICGPTVRLAVMAVYIGPIISCNRHLRSHRGSLILLTGSKFPKDLRLVVDLTIGLTSGR